MLRASLLFASGYIITGLSSANGGFLVNAVKIIAILTIVYIFYQDSR